MKTQMICLFFQSHFSLHLIFSFYILMYLSSLIFSSAMFNLSSITFSALSLLDIIVWPSHILLLSFVKWDERSTLSRAVTSPLLRQEHSVYFPWCPENYEVFQSRWLKQKLFLSLCEAQRLFPLITSWPLVAPHIHAPINTQLETFCRCLPNCYYLICPWNSQF